MLSIHSGARPTLPGFRAVILLLLAAALWGGCGAVRSECSATTPLDARELLTNAGFEVVYGSVVGAPNRKVLGSGPFRASMCN